MEEFDPIERGLDTPEGREYAIDNQEISGGEEGFLAGYNETPEEAED
ncbi:hypothetical protein K8R33_00285 [archaeon]|nr:hypothetical protein [archaeon]